MKELAPEEADSFFAKLCECTRYLKEAGVNARITITIAPNQNTFAVFVGMLVSRLRVRNGRTYLKTPHGLVRIKDVSS